MANLTFYRSDDCGFIEFQEDLTLNSNLESFRVQVAGFLEVGVRTISVRFTTDSYLSTRCIATLIGCLELVREKSARLIIVEPNKDILSVLRIIDIDKIITCEPVATAMNPHVGRPNEYLWVVGS